MEKVLYKYEHNGAIYCITQDSLISNEVHKCCRIHRKEKDSLGNDCWRQVYCSHDSSEENKIVHSIIEELLMVTKL